MSPPTQFRGNFLPLIFCPFFPPALAVIFRRCTQIHKLNMGKKVHFTYIGVFEHDCATGYGLRAGVSCRPPLLRVSSGSPPGKRRLPESMTNRSLFGKSKSKANHRCYLLSAFLHSRTQSSLACSYIRTCDECFVCSALWRKKKRILFIFAASKLRKMGKRRPDKSARVYKSLVKDLAKSDFKHGRVFPSFPPAEERKEREE